MTTASSHQPERIVVGVDGSLNSRAAVRWAVDHAHPGDTITLVHAWQSSPSRVDYRLVDPDDDAASRRFLDHELAHAQALRCAADVTITGELVRGEAGECLHQQPADLLVVGARSHHGVVGLLLGSVSNHLAQHCAVPMVIVPSPRRAADEGSAP